MRHLMLAAVVIAVSQPGCSDGDDTPANQPSTSPSQAAPKVPPGDPSTLPKINADRGQIAALLRERFGQDIARRIRIEVDDHAGGKRIGLTGEVPNEDIRQALMKELEGRVEGMSIADFRLELAGPIPMIFGFDARLELSRPTRFSPDLSLAVTPDGSVYEAATGRRLNRIAPPEHEFECMAFSPDGKSLATGHRHCGIIVWEMPLGRNPRTISPFAPTTSPTFENIYAVAFTHDGKHLVSISGKHGDIRLWDLGRRGDPTARTIGAHLPHDSPRQVSEPFVLAVSPDDKTIASASFDEDSISLWDVASRSRKDQLSAERIHPEVLAWSHDGKSIAAGRGTGDRRGAVIFDLATKRARVLALERDELIGGLAFSPDDRMLAVRYENKGVGLWDVQAGTPWMTLDHVKVGGGEGIAFSPDGAVLATECDTLTPQGIRLWDVSRRPGSTSAVAALPAAYPDQPAQDDRLCAEIEGAIRGTFDPRNIHTLKVEMLEGGSIKLTGKVSDAEVKRVAQQTAEVRRSLELPGPRELGKVINELEVTGRLAD